MGNRHGDVMIKPVSVELADKVKAQSGREESQLTIALGEAHPWPEDKSEYPSEVGMGVFQTCGPLNIPKKEAGL